MNRIKIIFSACQAAAADMGGNTINWSPSGQCSVRNCTDPPEDNLSLGVVTGADVYTGHPCTPTTTTTSKPHTMQTMMYYKNTLLTGKYENSPCPYISRRVLHADTD